MAMNDSARSSAQLRPNDNTIQLQHQNMQKMIEKAIKDANNQEIDKLSYAELKQSLFNLDYLQAYKAFERHKPTSMNSPMFLEQLQEEKEFLDGVWSYTNPKKNEFIQKSHTFDILLLLMFNSKRQNKELVSIVGQFLVD